MYKFSEKNYLKYFAKALIPKNKNLIFTLHNITSENFIWFEEFIKRYKHRIKSFSEFGYHNNLNNKEIYLTFDDGFYSNYLICKNILDKYNIKALFFLTNNFINLDSDSAFNFARLNFYPNSKLVINKEVNSMNYDNIHELIYNGHLIGSHTFNHPILKSLTYLEQYNEIVNSKIILEKTLNIKIKHFAYPFGNSNFINKDSIQITIKNFDYAYTNVRGSIEISPTNHLIYRQNIVPGMPFWLTDAIADSKIDFLYKNERKKIKSLLY
jgi:peptidoglycan/xylan/chitin deacetylase (PgdA/CDA1 family)